MKSVVGVSCFLSDKRLEMRIFDGLRGGVMLAGHTVDSYGYGRHHTHIYALWRNVRKRGRESHENFKQQGKTCKAIRAGKFYMYANGKRINHT